MSALRILVGIIAIGLPLTGCANRSVSVVPQPSMVLPDRDRDGLPDGMEDDFATDPRLTDTDGDSLSDYWEIRKYRTNPLLPDSDGDGVPDNEWEERAEFTRTLRAVVDLRPPFDVRHMNDFHQDARTLDELGDDVTRVEVVLYPDAVPIINASPYRPVRSEYTAPTYTKNYSAQMKNGIRRRLKGSATDVQVVSRILWQLRETRHVDLVKDLGCENDLPAHFHLHRDGTGAIVESGIPDSYAARKGIIRRTVVLADSMWRLGTRGACGSSSILRGAMLRAAGIPERTIMTIPLLYSYETDDTRIEVQSDYSRELLNIAAGNNSICDHFFNEVWIGNQWVRVDSRIGTGGIILWGKVPGMKILECHDPTDHKLFTYWNYSTWQTHRPYKYVSVVERPARHQRSN
jgi:hypothetical protein